MKKILAVLMVTLIGVCFLLSLTACVGKGDAKGEQCYRVDLNLNSYYEQTFEIGDLYGDYERGGDVTKNDRSAPIREIYYNSETRTITLVTDLDTVIIGLSAEDYVVCYKLSK